MPQFDTSVFQSSISWLLIVLSAMYYLYKHYVIPNFLKLLNQRQEYIRGFEEKERKIQFERREIFRKNQELIQQTQKECQEEYLDKEKILTAKSKKKIADYHQQLLEKYQSEEKILMSQFDFLEKSISSKGQEIAHEIVESLSQLSDEDARLSQQPQVLSQQ